MNAPTQPTLFEATDKHAVVMAASHLVSATQEVQS